MFNMRLVSITLAFGLAVLLQGCMGTIPERMIKEHDHPGLAMLYAQEAKELREKARQWEFMAEYYEKHSEPHGKTEPAQHAAHCRAIAQNYKKAADEADALASEHRAMHPRDMVQ